MYLTKARNIKFLSVSFILLCSQLCVQFKRCDLKRNLKSKRFDCLHCVIRLIYVIITLNNKHVPYNK